MLLVVLRLSLTFTLIQELGPEFVHVLERYPVREQWLCGRIAGYFFQCLNETERQKHAGEYLPSCLAALFRDLADASKYFYLNGDPRLLDVVKCCSLCLAIRD